MSYKQQAPLPVNEGGTGDLTLNVHGVLIGETTSSIVSTSAGTNGQVFLGSTSANPAFGTLSSSNSSITFTTGPASLSLQTGTAVATSFPTDSGTAVPSSGALTIAGGSNINTSGSGSTVTVNLNNSISVSGSITAGTDITSTNGNFYLPYTTATVGTIFMGGVRWLHAFGNDTGGNLFLGKNSGNYTATLLQNTAVGENTLNALTSGVQNVVMGFEVAQLLTSGRSNAMVGYSVASSASTASYCTIMGNVSCLSLLTGIGNTVFGAASALNLTSGSYNVIIGSINGVTNASGSGTQYTSSESSNIIIGNIGTTGESNVIRIGTTGTGTQLQNKCFIAGIYNTSIGATNHIVSVDSNGQLGLTSGPESFTWTDVTGATQAMVPNNGYVADHTTLITFTLPTVAAFGTLMSVVGLNTGGWKIAQNAGQNIQFGNLSTTSGVTGSLASTNQYDQVDLLCIVANLTWTIRGPISNLTIV